MGWLERVNLALSACLLATYPDGLPVATANKRPSILLRPIWRIVGCRPSRSKANLAGGWAALGSSNIDDQNKAW